MNISIVIPNWNGREKLEKNLAKVLGVRGVEEVILVDDGSKDESVNFIQANYPQIRLLKKSQNSGFGTTVNLGVEQALGEFVFLLNTDAAPEPDCLEYALKNFQSSDVFSVSCNTGGNWSWAKFESGFFWHYQVPLKPGEVLQTHETLWASGGSGIFRKSIWQTLGGFDPLYNPFYSEDLDLGYRAWKRGFRNIWEVNSKVLHIKGQGVISSNFSKGHIQRISERNNLIFTWKNITDLDLTNKHFKGLAKRLITNPKYWLTFISTLIKFPKISQKRAQEKKDSKLTDRQILERYAMK